MEPTIKELEEQAYWLLVDWAKAQEEADWLDVELNLLEARIARLKETP